MLTDSEWAEVDRIPGWLFRAEADCIMRHAGSPWCEVGAWKGRSTAVLVKGGPGFVVDTFRGSGEEECPHGPSVRADWERNVGWPGVPVTVLHGSFERMVAAVPSNLRVLYLDAEHSYGATRLAWATYSPLVAPGGVVMVHDAWGVSGWPECNPHEGVTAWVREVLEVGDWVQVDTASRLAVLRRAP